MSIEIDSVRRVRVLAESEFGLDETSSLASFQDVPFVEDSFSASLDEDMQSPEFAQQHIDGRSVQVHGPKSGSLSFDIPLLVSGSATAAGETVSVNPALHTILSTVLGGTSIPTARAVDSGDTESVTLDGANSFEKGGAIGIGGELREIEDIDSAEVFPKLVFSTTPSGVAYAATTYFPAPNPDGSLQFVIEGLHETDRWLVTGVQLDSLELSDLNPGSMPKLSISLTITDWFHGADAATDLTGVDLGHAEYVNYEPVIVMDSSFRVAQVGSTSLSGTVQDAAAISINPNISYVAAPSPGGVQTRIRWVRARGEAPQGSFTVPWDGPDWLGAKADRTPMAIYFQIGSAPGNAALLTVPTVQITNVQRTEHDGLAYQEVSWSARKDEGCYSPSDPIAFAPFRIHLT